MFTIALFSCSRLQAWKCLFCPDSYASFELSINIDLEVLYVYMDRLISDRFGQAAAPQGARGVRGGSWPETGV